GGGGGGGGAEEEGRRGAGEQGNRGAGGQRRESVTHRVSRITFYVLLAALILTTLRATPHEIAYFNALTGGAENTWYYLSDSNTDWMQGLKALKAWQEQTGIIFKYAGPEGYTGLRSYGLDYTSLPSTVYNPEPLFKPAFTPPPGDYVLSVHALNGLGLIDPDNYAWFRYHTPTTIIAGVLYHYHVEPTLTPTWLVQCTVPAVPLDEATITEQFSPPPRAITFDCTQAWLYPHEGMTRGWYALHAQALRPEPWYTRLIPHPPIPTEDFVARHLRDVPLGYRQYSYRNIPAFALYEWQGNREAEEQGGRGAKGQRRNEKLNEMCYAAAAGTVPGTLTGEGAVYAPVALQGELTYLGSTVYLSETALEVETWWQVTGTPTGQPLSVMAHLLTEEGQNLGVADGMSIPPTSWEEGDILVQRHHFENNIIPDGAELWLRTGIYRLEDGNRWPLSSHEGADALFIKLF
ncbi:MAG: hypothetical protein JXA33_02355, partial [Anaerolineae bacterium]|nr:hypothetical protein [Anaerolineae bacterium]